MPLSEGLSSRCCNGLLSGEKLELLRGCEADTPPDDEVESSSEGDKCLLRSSVSVRKSEISVSVGARIPEGVFVSAFDEKVKLSVISLPAEMLRSVVAVYELLADIVCVHNSISTSEILYGRKEQEDQHILIS
jgi:hypothetical protein